jgi:glycerol-3-phosphate acyltransferase PlsY
LYWPIGACVAAIWLFVAKILKISSASALVSMGLAPIIVWWFRPQPALVGMQVIITLLLFVRHRSNIRNLLQGSEGKIGVDGDEPDSPGAPHR